MSVNNFSFVVLTYNHEKYVIEHLESIKFLIEEFGAGIDFQVIIADDGSRDETVLLAEYWLSKNRDLFFDVLVLSERGNKGTCHNFTKFWPHVKTDYFKVTAGDDVYSCENMFHDFENVDQFDIVAGMPLTLVDGVISKSGFSVFNIVATNAIYRDSDYIERLRGIGFSNTPSMSYPVRLLGNEDVRDFVRSFSVTEDYPLHVRMAEVFRPLRFHQIDRVFVYYRRTEGSTYLIRRDDFNEDKARVFEYLTAGETRSWRKLLLRNRLFCYKLDGRFVRRVVNLSYYLYLLKVALNLPGILRSYSRFKVDVRRHQQHFDEVERRAAKVLIEFGVLPSIKGVCEK